MALGTTMETYPGKDNLVRVAKVRVGKNEFLRLIHRLFPWQKD